MNDMSVWENVSMPIAYTSNKSGDFIRNETEMWSHTFHFNFWAQHTLLFLQEVLWPTQRLRLAEIYVVS